ncbi:MAG: hypothetical protein ACOZE5_08945 [Verrucomicrobiota bacterium]
MPTETKSPDDAVAELVGALPAHLRENFERTQKLLIADHGLSPPVPTLVRLWLACATPERVRREFEEAVLQISGTSRQPADDVFDEEDL